MSEKEFENFARCLTSNLNRLEIPEKDCIIGRGLIIPKRKQKTGCT